MRIKDFFELLKSAAFKWSEHNAPRLGAALAYYMLLSLAPLLIIVVAICGLVFSEATVKQQVLMQVRTLAGAAGENSVSMLIENAHRPQNGALATFIAILTLLSGASGVFAELRESLNTIWEAPSQSSTNWLHLIRQRLISFGMVLALGLSLLVSLILSTALAIAERFFFDLIPIQVTILSEIANIVVSLLAISVLFGLIFKFVPDVRIYWRDVTIGAVFTAVLFSVGKTVLSLYLGTVGVGSTYGAAGSLVALVVWAYYSAQIFFFGAVFTRVYTEKWGSKKEVQPLFTTRQPA
jgi:membrane protein